MGSDWTFWTPTDRVYQEMCTLTPFSGHHHSAHGALSAAPNSDHFVDSDKMVLHSLAAVETGHPGLLDYRQKVAVIRVENGVRVDFLDANRSRIPRDVYSDPIFLRTK